MKRLLIILLAAVWPVLSAFTQETLVLPDSLAADYVDLNQPGSTHVSQIHAALSRKGTHLVSFPVCYRSVDQNGEDILLSGKIYLPRGVNARNIILLPHYTIASLKEAPSACDPIEAQMLRREDYILLMPDYIGYGISADRVHPYLRQDLTSRNCVDMFLAAKPFLASICHNPVSDSLIILGYSQGAQTAVGCLKLLETEYPEIPIKKCYAGSGPYDVGVTYDVSIAQDHTGMALTVPMLIMGTSEAYGLNLRREDFFSPLLMEHYDDWIVSKSHSIISLHFKIGSGRISRLMTKEGMDKTQPESARMYAGFIRSSIVHISEQDTLLGDWSPRTPMFVFHSTNDDIVPFANAEHLQWMLQTNAAAQVSYDFGRYGGHAVCVITYLRKVRRMLRES